jgi:protein TonB
MAPTIPSDRTQSVMRWGVCLAVVLALHVFGVLKLLEHSDANNSPPGSGAVPIDVASGELEDQVDPVPYAPPVPVQQEKKAEQEPEQRDAEVVLPKEVEQPEPTPVQPAPAQDAREAHAPAKPAPEVVRTWQAAIGARLKECIRYPQEAIARRQRGKGVLAFTLDADGRVVSSAILKGSGSAILDREILDLVGRCQPFPAPPDGLDERARSLHVPVNYDLQ